jgi:hypothetical protein
MTTRAIARLLHTSTFLLFLKSIGLLLLIVSGILAIFELPVVLAINLLMFILYLPSILYSKLNEIRLSRLALRLPISMMEAFYLAKTLTNGGMGFAIGMKAAFFCKARYVVRFIDSSQILTTMNIDSQNGDVIQDEPARLSVWALFKLAFRRNIPVSLSFIVVEGLIIIGYVVNLLLEGDLESSSFLSPITFGILIVMIPVYSPFAVVVARHYCFAKTLLQHNIHKVIPMELVLEKVGQAIPNGIPYRIHLLKRHQCLTYECKVIDSGKKRLTILISGENGEVTDIGTRWSRMKKWLIAN